MIIHYNHDKPANVYVVNSRFPVYKACYGDGLGITILGLFARMAPKVAPFAKQAGMKAIEVIRDKGIGAIGDLAEKAFSAAKNKITSLVRRRNTPLPSTAVMPLQVNKIINEAVQQKLESLTPSLTTPSLMTPNQDNIMANMIAGSGFKNSRRVYRYESK